MTLPRRGRLLLLAGGGLGLLAGLWSGLARAGVHRPLGPLMEHGILMVLGFLGTLIALERAVALGRRWAYAAPAASATSVVAILAGAPIILPGMLLTGAGTVVVATYLALLRHRASAHLVIMALGSGLWVAAAALWSAGWSPPQVSPMLAGFLVLTIVGERVELSRFVAPPSRRPLFLAVAAFVGGVAWTAIDRSSGLVLAGLGLLGQTAWLTRHDVARFTIRRDGLPRFAAVCTSAGYLWLAVSGGLWIALGSPLSAPLLYDAALHTVFLGFAISMVMGHAPIILPAVLGVRLPHTGLAWVPLASLHLSVAARVGADLLGSSWARGWTAHGNTAAMLLFVATCVVAVRRGSRDPNRLDTSPTVPSTPTTVGVAPPPGVLP